MVQPKTHKFTNEVNLSMMNNLKLADSFIPICNIPANHRTFVISYLDFDFRFIENIMLNIN